MESDSDKRSGADRITRSGGDGKKLSPSHKRSAKQERELAKRFGGRITPGSGSKHIKGDVSVKGIARIEAKATIKRSFSVTLEMVDKIEQAALHSGQLPMMVIEFLDECGKPIKEVALMPVWAIEELVERTKNE